MAWDDIRQQRALDRLNAAYTAAQKELTAADAAERDPVVWELLTAAGNVGRLLAPEHTWPASWPEG